MAPRRALESQFARCRAELSSRQVSQRITHTRGRNVSRGTRQLLTRIG